MARIQLALNVPDLDEAIAFYEVLLDASPHKQRPGYANFAVQDPPLKLVLIESDGNPNDCQYTSYYSWWMGYQCRRSYRYIPCNWYDW